MQRIAEICANFIAVALGLVGGLLLFQSLPPVNPAYSLESTSDYLMFISDVFFSLIACVLCAVLAKFMLWDCLIQPLVVFFAGKRSKKRYR